MEVDGLTLLIAGCFVAGLGGMLVLNAWLDARGTRALLWWGLGHLVNGVAVLALAMGMATARPLVTMIGGVGIAASMTLHWSGTRVFVGRIPSPWVIAGTISAAIAACLLGNPRTAVAVACLLTAGLLAAACRELARPQEGQLRSPWALMVVFALHAAFMACGFVGLLLGTITVDATPSVTSWFGLINFERLVFLIAGALFMVTMARERAEALSVKAATVDSLTGIATRGAFFDRAERIFRRAGEEGTTLSLIAFDLDHFKAVNDTFGHATGDRALKTFADTASSLLAANDLFGRIGGEEFVAVLPGTGLDAATVVANRIRHVFEQNARDILGEPATVSAGVAFSNGEIGLAALLEAADSALYRAKAHGRNRVERDDTRRSMPRPRIRVA